VSISPDGRLVVSVDDDGEVVAWALQKDRHGKYRSAVIKTFSRFHAEANSVSTVGSAGRYLAAIAYSNSRMVVVNLMYEDSEVVVRTNTEDNPKTSGVQGSEQGAQQSDGRDSPESDCSDLPTSETLHALEPSAWKAQQILDFEAYVHNAGAEHTCILSWDGLFLATASNSGYASLWGLGARAHKAQRVHEITYDAPVHCAAIWRGSTGYTWVAHGLNSALCMVYKFPRNIEGTEGTEAGTPDLEETFALRHTKTLEIRAVGLLYQGEKLLCVTGAQDRTLRLWDVNLGAVIQVVKDAHGHHILSAAMSWDGRVLATGGRDRMMRLWTYNDSLGVLSPHMPIPCFKSERDVYAVSVGYSRGPAVYVSDSNKISVVDIAGGQEHCVLTGSQVLVRFLCVALNRRANKTKCTVLSGDEHGNLSFWDGSSGAQLGFIKFLQNRFIVCVESSGDGTVAAAGSLDGSIVMVDLASKQVVNTISHVVEQAYHGAVVGLSLSWDGSVCACAGSDGQVKVFIYGKEVWCSPQYTGPILHVALSPDGCTVVYSTSDGGISAWRWAGIASKVFATAGPTSPILIAFEWMGLSTRWNPMYRGTQTFPYAGSPQTVSVSHDGRLILGASSFGITIFDLETNGELPFCNELGGGRAEFAFCAYSPERAVPAIYRYLESSLLPESLSSTQSESSSKEGYWFVVTDGSVLRLVRLFERGPKFHAGHVAWDYDLWEYCTGTDDVHWLKATIQSTHPLQIIAIDSQPDIRKLALWEASKVPRLRTQDEELNQNVELLTNDNVSPRQRGQYTSRSDTCDDLALTRTGRHHRTPRGSDREQPMTGGISGWKKWQMYSKLDTKKFSHARHRGGEGVQDAWSATPDGKSSSPLSPDAKWLLTNRDKKMRKNVSKKGIDMAAWQVSLDVPTILAGTAVVVAVTAVVTTLYVRHAIQNQPKD